MITNDLGTVWPPEDVQLKIQKNSQMLRLYKGEHESVFGNNHKDKRIYITANLLGALTDMLSWRLFGEKIFVYAPEDMGGNQEFIDHLLGRNRIREKMLDAAKLQSYTGECYFKVRYDAEQQRIVILPIDNNRVITEYSELDADKVTSRTIWQVLSDDKHKYVWFEQHFIGEDNKSYIANFLYQAAESDGELRFDVKEDRVDLTAHVITANLPELQATGISRLLVCGISGSSDYEGLLTIQAEINNRLTQRAKTLDIHAMPLMFGPIQPGEDGTVDVGGFQFIPTYSTDAAPVGTIVWDASLQAVTDAMREYRELFAATAGIEMSAIIAPEGGGPQSGRAIKLSQMRTQSRVLAKQILFEPLITELLCVAIELAMVPGVILADRPSEKLYMIDEEDLTVEFGDGLPSDSMDMIEEQARRIEYGLQSKRDAIKALDDCSDEAADIKIAQIQAEEVGSLHSGASLLSTGSPDFNSLLSPAGTNQ